MNANKLFDAVIAELKLKNDAALCKRLVVNAPAISNMRASRLAVGAALMISIHEETGWPVKRIKALLADDTALTQVAA